jgi:hypothetical protein
VLLLELLLLLLLLEVLLLVGLLLLRVWNWVTHPKRRKLARLIAMSAAAVRVRVAPLVYG